MCRHHSPAQINVATAHRRAGGHPLQLSVLIRHLSVEHPLALLVLPQDEGPVGQAVLRRERGNSAGSCWSMTGCTCLPMRLASSAAASPAMQLLVRHLKPLDFLQPSLPTSSAYTSH